MGIGPETRAYLSSTLKKAIALFYGERVLSLEDFRKKRRKTFMEKLELQVDAQGWRNKIAEATQKRGTAQGVVTRLQNERSAKQVEMQQKQNLELQELKTKHQAQLTALAAHYEPDLLEANEGLRLRQEEMDRIVRAAYFAGLGIEDDNRSVYRSSLDDAISQRVDSYIEAHLMEDEEGSAVKERVRQEQLVSDATFIAEKVPSLREMVLNFIKAGKLPPITVEAWLIENGKDLSG